MGDQEDGLEDGSLFHLYQSPRKSSLFESTGPPVSSPGMVVLFIVIPTFSLAQMIQCKIIWLRNQQQTIQR
jgi:hypothetical protein